MVEASQQTKSERPIVNPLCCERTGAAHFGAPVGLPRSAEGWLADGAYHQSLWRRTLAQCALEPSGSHGRQLAKCDPDHDDRCRNNEVAVLRLRANGLPAGVWEVSVDYQRVCFMGVCHEPGELLRQQGSANERQTRFHQDANHSMSLGPDEPTCGANGHSANRQQTVEVKSFMTFTLLQFKNQSLTRGFRVNVVEC